MRRATLTLDRRLFEELHGHLFPGDGDEHGAVLVAGLAQTSRGLRLLGREVFPARDGLEYLPGTRGYRALTARFVAERSGYCADQELCYLAVHNHGGRDDVTFSADDLASHDRGYPALLDITSGGPVGALVFSENAVAGDIWTREGRVPLDYLTIIGPCTQRLFPKRPSQSAGIDPLYDRHTRLFGDAGQDILSKLKVGIIGLGGGGSLLNEWLARLGIGHIVAVDFDRVELSNLPRVVGATRWDAMAYLATCRYLWLQRIGRRLARHKVHVAERVARQANQGILFDAVVGNVLDDATARLLTDVDFLFLASDAIQTRLVFNALIHQYLIPGMQIGVKVSGDPQTGQVGDIFVATRPVLPYPGGGCLECHQLIPPSRLQAEALTENERRAQRYVEDEAVAQPSVITLNALSAAQAANDLMMMFTGLFEEQVELRQQMHWIRERTVAFVEPRTDPLCPDCGVAPTSRRARGDRARLPCRPGRANALP